MREHERAGIVSMSNTNNTNPITVSLMMDGASVEYTRTDTIRADMPATDSAGRPYVIARCTQAGVHAGYLLHRDAEDYVVLCGARRIWHWEGAATLSELAVYGAAKPEACKFGVTIKRQELAREDVCEIIHCQPEGRKMIEECKEWRANG